MKGGSSFAGALLRAAGAVLAPGGAAARLSTVIFHRVLAERDPLQPQEVTAADFELLLCWLGEQFSVIPMREAIAGLRSGRLPARPLVISFDDGYADNHDVAAPILHRLGLPATFFVATGYLDGGRMFNDVVAAALAGCRGPELDLGELGFGRYATGGIDDRQRALAALLPRVKPLPVERRDAVALRICELAGVRPPEGLMMTSGQVAALKRSGFEIGGHTVTHPILCRLDAAAAGSEIRKGRARLAEITGAPIAFFAYPNGRPGEDYSAQTVALVREAGFDAAFTTAPGVATGETDLYQLPRFTPWDRSRWKFGARMIGNLLNRNPLTVRAPGAPVTNPVAA